MCLLVYWHIYLYCLIVIGTPCNLIDREKTYNIFITYTVIGDILFLIFIVRNVIDDRPILGHI